MSQTANCCTCTSTDNWTKIEAESRAVLGDDLADYIAVCRSEEHGESQLISVLHRTQAKFGHLGREHLDAVAQLMQIPGAKVTGVATFYHFFHLEPRGRFVINVCMGTACYVRGADRVAQKVKDELGIDFGETTKDGMFSLEAARCLGTCGLAPVIMIDDNVHPQVTPDQIPAILGKYMEMART
jgi:NADH:ubiquinone oxidoreductase subunit E